MAGKPRSKICGRRQTLGSHNFHGRHCYPRRAPCPRACPLLGSRHEPGAFSREVLHVVEIDAENEAAAVLVFDLEDIDAAFDELDARYLAGEAADHARTWSVIARASRHSTDTNSSRPTQDYMNIDHRRTTTFAPGDLSPYLTPPGTSRQIRDYIDAVHRLSSLGAVLTHTARGPRTRDSTPSGG